ncbi:aspartate/glutamate racemase family protein [Nocardioides insulae]|uniref:aspartate/glutamate racemase family protein n=1 Tax=Nocardioides insulae TaxID=394734 RepID=UPI000421F123|nr:amino acid racemase [Nocardioides insulae]
MKTIGLIGGMSWESSAVYYQGLNTGVQQQLGGLSSARIVLASVDFAEVTALQESEDWDAVATLLAAAARGVEQAGADFILLCTTTFHLVYDAVQAAVSVPVVHLADVVAARCQEQGITKVAFLGTAFSMERRFFCDRLDSHGIDVNVPDEMHHQTVDSIIYDELVRGEIKPNSRRRVISVIDELWDAGAGAVILGCTELELLVKQSDLEIPVLGVTSAHIEDALKRALA